MSTDVLAFFLNFKYFISTWIIFASFFGFGFSSLKLFQNALSCFISMSSSSTFYIPSLILSFRVWHNLSSSSKISVVSFSLESFSASPCSSLSIFIIHRTELFRVDSFRIFFRMLLQIKHLVLLLFMSQFLSLASFSA